MRDPEVRWCGLAALLIAGGILVVGGGLLGTVVLMCGLPESRLLSWAVSLHGLVYELLAVALAVLTAVLVSVMRDLRRRPAAAVAERGPGGPCKPC